MRSILRLKGLATNEIDGGTGEPYDFAAMDAAIFLNIAKNFEEQEYSEYTCLRIAAEITDSAINEPNKFPQVRWYYQEILVQSSSIFGLQFPVEWSSNKTNERILALCLAHTILTDIQKSLARRRKK